MKKIFLLGFLLICLDGYTQTDANDIEQKIFDCICKAYENQDIDLKAQVSKFENYLIEKKVFNDPSGKSYREYFEKLSKSDDFNLYIDDKLLKEVQELKLSNQNASCVKEVSILYPNETPEKLSKWILLDKKINKESENINNFKLQFIAQAYLEVFDNQDFEQPYLKFITLDIIAQISDSDKAKLNIFKPPLDSLKLPETAKKIQLKIDANNEIRLYGKKTSLNKLKNYLKKSLEKNKPNYFIEYSSSRATMYKIYIQVLDIIKLALTELRNDLAIEKYGKGYEKLQENEKKSIQDVYPLRISESESKE